MDMADLVDRLETKRAGRSLNDYLRDDDPRDIVERKLEKIGGLMFRLRDHDPATVARIGGFQKIIGLRNLISNDLGNVSDERLWGSCRTFYPPWRATCSSSSRIPSRLRTEWSLVSVWLSSRDRRG